MSSDRIGLDGSGSSAAATQHLQELLGRITAALERLDSVADGALPTNAVDEESRDLRTGYEALRDLMVAAVAAARNVAEGKQDQMDAAVAALERADEAADRALG